MHRENNPRASCLSLVVCLIKATPGPIQLMVPVSLLLELPCSVREVRVVCTLALSRYLWESKWPGPLCVSILGRLIH